MNKLVVIMGATGTGKSRLSVDLASLFRGEIINSDKIQVYRGLDITTNKLPLPSRRGVPHHLLGSLDPSLGSLPPAHFRSLALSAASSISRRNMLPIVAGGSNSYIRALLGDKNLDRCRVCLLWVGVEEGVLAENLDRRVEEMVGEGMVGELERYWERGERHEGLGKAIGVAEFGGYFRRRTGEAYREAVEEIKANTRRLAEEQVRKIGGMGWEVGRVDATRAVEARLGGGEEEGEWEEGVLRPSVEMVERFLGR